MAKKENAVVKADDNRELTTHEMPDFMKGQVQTGLEELDDTDYILPIIKLLQATDDAVQTGKGAAGEFFHLTAERNLGKNVMFIPCFVRKRYMLFRPNDGSAGSGTMVLARADDGVHWSPPDATFDVRLKGKKEAVRWHTKPTVVESGLDKFGSGDPDDPQSRPAATLIYDIVAILPEYPELSPAVISLKGAGVKKAKGFFTGLRSARAPIFGLLFSMYGTLEKNGSNSYWLHNVKGEGFVKSQEMYKQGESLNKICSSERFGVSHEDGPEAEVVATQGEVNANY